MNVITRMVPKVRYEAVKIINFKEVVRCRDCGSLIEDLPVWKKKHDDFHNVLKPLKPF